MDELKILEAVFVYEVTTRIIDLRDRAASGRLRASGYGSCSFDAVQLRRVADRRDYEAEHLESLVRLAEMEPVMGSTIQ